MYMLLNAYAMLLVMIYVEYIYVDGEIFTCYWCCCWWKHVLNYVDMDLWNYMKYVLWCRVLVHTQLIWWLSSQELDAAVVLMWVVIRVVWRVYMRHGRRPQRWKRVFGTTLSRVGLVTLYVYRRSHVCSWCLVCLMMHVIGTSCCIIVVENWHLFRITFIKITYLWIDNMSRMHVEPVFRCWLWLM